jgi:hypothetical protein
MTVRVAEEHVAKRAFAWAIDWPGWCRSGKTVDLALEALVMSLPRFGVVVDRAGLIPPVIGEARTFEIVDSVEGGATTDFGAPERITASDLRPTDGAEADRLGRLVEASWLVFSDVVAHAPAELRKGPRGGGRDRDKVVEHVILAEHAYARTIGIKPVSPDLADATAVAAMRAAMAAALRVPADGSPMAGRKWPPRYAARRIAWHVLDHAWEIEDRSESV